MVPPRLTLVSDNTREKSETAPGEDAEGSRAAGAASRPTAALSDPDAAIDHLSKSVEREKLRRLEAMLFASSQPLDAKSLARCLDANDDVHSLLIALQAEYKDRGVTLVRVAGRWQFRTADDLSFLLERQQKEERKLSKAALETLAIIAYHQPVTRAEIEEIRGVSTSPGTLDVLMETGWIRPRGRRRAPGRPLTYGTTEDFLVHFGLDNIKDLPGLADLKAAGLLDANLPPGFTVPSPTDVAALMPDELPLTDDGDEEEEEQSVLPLEDDGEEPDEAQEPDESGESKKQEGED
ncbi:SMC-Scp complex subunit ScpB [Hyphomicrobium facile]|uniref:Segregation and condensation protein B n=1 Tax=Hyphomicrobium facile TaxID=51670 RepID=A0A1I7NES8_9HYPH|nr:SMC-Scp complex subunit ScpB [Hyphomicrobium facile]SFV33056.1 segregation and condensation protein B [Hyphomicrobium facile]